MSNFENNSSRSAIPLILLPFGTVLVYVLSIGPALYLIERFPEMQPLLEKMYAPLFYFEFPWFMRFLDYYCQFWMNIPK